MRTLKRFIATCDFTQEGNFCFQGKPQKKRELAIREVIDHVLAEGHVHVDEVLVRQRRQTIEELVDAVQPSD